MDKVVNSSAFTVFKYRQNIFKVTCYLTYAERTIRGGLQDFYVSEIRLGASQILPNQLRLGDNLSINIQSSLVSSWHCERRCLALLQVQPKPKPPRKKLYILYRWSLCEVQWQITVLWQAVDQSGEVVDMFLQAKRDGSATKRFLMSFVRPYSE